MRIVELKSQSTKIIYKPSQEEIKVGDFISLIENDLTIIAQVYKILSSDVADDFNQADLQFILVHKYDKTNLWQGEVVSADALVEKTPFKLIENYISNTEMESPFAVGKSLAYGMPITFDFAKFQAPIFVGYEKVEDNAGLLDNFAAVFNALGKSLVILDYKGNVEIANSKKILAGVQAKLPLNTSMIEKLSSKILEGVSLENKVVIEDVLLELAQYAEQTNTGFIPISTLIQTIDDFYKKNKLTPLILLKNKLCHYRRLNIFADTVQEVKSLYNAIKDYNIVVFDLSDIQQEWQNEFLVNLIEPDKNIEKDFYLYISIDNRNFDNNIMNYLLFKAVQNGISPIISANYRHLAFDSIFDFSKNMFLFKTYNALKKRSILSDILQTLPPECFILHGKLTANTILSLSIKGQFNAGDITAEVMNKSINETKNMEVLNNAIEDDQALYFAENVQNHQQDNNFADEPATEYEAAPIYESQEQESVEEIPVMENEINIDDLNEQQASKIGIPIEPGVVKKEDEVIEIKMPEPEEEPIEEDEILELVGLDEEITDDLFEEVVPDDDNLEDVKDLDFFNEPQEQVQEDDSDEELFDLIDEAPAPAQQNLPVYDANYQQKNKSNENFTTNLQEGDLVKHDKYGLGTIKKITTHGEKVLCHINFDNFGRRLLDPEISQLQKLN